MSQCLALALSSLWLLTCPCILLFPPRTGLNKSILLPNTSELYTPAVFPLCTHAILFSRAAVFVIMNTYKPFVSNKGERHKYTYTLTRAYTILTHTYTHSSTSIAFLVIQDSCQSCQNAWFSCVYVHVCICIRICIWIYIYILYVLLGDWMLHVTACEHNLKVKNKECVYMTMTPHNILSLCHITVSSNIYINILTFIRSFVPTNHFLSKMWQNPPSVAPNWAIITIKDHLRTGCSVNPSERNVTVCKKNIELGNQDMNQVTTPRYTRMCLIAARPHSPYLRPACRMRLAFPSTIYSNTTTRVHIYIDIDIDIDIYIANEKQRNVVRERRRCWYHACTLYQTHTEPFNT